MALVAPVENGKVVETDSQNSLKNKSKTSNDGMDKDAFLQLLVAQMKYQDPLEPTSNTEYISQYAQFSQVEQLQNMAGNMELLRASSLVGQEVYVKTTNSNGDSKYIKGKVDYIVYENNKAYLSINEQLYSLDDLDTVVDKEYDAAYDKATDLVNRINKLPNVKAIDYTNVREIDDLEKIYDEMSDYEKTFVASEKVTALKEYIEKAKEVKYAATQDFIERLGKLPEVSEISLSNADEIDALENLYSKMDEYEKSYVESDKVTALNQYVEKIKELRAEAEESEETEGKETEGAE